MRQILLCIAALVVVAGCSSGNTDDGMSKLPPGAGKPMNPSGKMSPEQQQKADQISSDALKADKARGEALRSMQAGGK